MGVYELVFHAGDYLRRRGCAMSEPAFLDQSDRALWSGRARSQLSCTAAALAVRLQHLPGIVMADLVTKSSSACRQIAKHTEEPGFITRTFLSEPMHACTPIVRTLDGPGRHDSAYDAAGNIRGLYARRKGGCAAADHRIASGYRAARGCFRWHPGRGAGRRIGGAARRAAFPFAIEVVGFSEEEGVRFGVPFIGSRALIGDVDGALAGEMPHGISVADAIRAFGLDPAEIAGGARHRTDASDIWSFTLSKVPCSKV